MQSEHIEFKQGPFSVLGIKGREKRRPRSLLDCKFFIYLKLSDSCKTFFSLRTGVFTAVKSFHLVIELAGEGDRKCPLANLETN